MTNISGIPNCISFPIKWETSIREKKNHHFIKRSILMVYVGTTDVEFSNMWILNGSRLIFDDKVGNIWSHVNGAVKPVLDFKKENGWTKRRFKILHFNAKWNILPADRKIIFCQHFFILTY